MSELILIMPEVLLALTLAFVLVGEITYHGERYRLISITALLGLGSALLQTAVAYGYGANQIFHNALSIDGLSFFFRLLFITLAGLAVIASMHTKEIVSSQRAEYIALVLAATLGMCLAASAADLMLAFLALQFVNVVGYFLAGYSKRSAVSNEAAVKYMVFAVVAAGLLAYGMAVLLASTHVLNIYEIHKALLALPPSRETALVVFTLVFMALAFQMGAFPMHFWAPDVMEGAPTPVSTVLAVGFRAAGFAVAMRFLVVLFSQPALTEGRWSVIGNLDWTQMVALVSGLTMLIGAFLAIRQRGAKRMVAALIVAETGYLLVGLLVLDTIGIAAILYNLVIELFAITGIFYILSFLVGELKSDRLEDLRGMLGRAVPECICLLFFLITLIGLPPSPGFVGKFILIGAALRQDWTMLAAIAIVSITVSTVAVARLGFSLIGDFAQSSRQPMTPDMPRKVFLAALVTPVILTGVFAEEVLAWAVKSISFILW